MLLLSPASSLKELSPPGRPVLRCRESSPVANETVRVPNGQVDSGDRHKAEDVCTDRSSRRTARHTSPHVRPDLRKGPCGSYLGNRFAGCCVHACTPFAAPCRARGTGGDALRARARKSSQMHVLPAGVTADVTPTRLRTHGRVAAAALLSAGADAVQTALPFCARTGTGLCVVSAAAHARPAPFRRRLFPRCVYC